MRLEQGTEVRVDIPDTTGLYFERYHNYRGTIVAIELTGDTRDNVLYRANSVSILSFFWACF
jgi:hypothetical protein